MTSTAARNKKDGIGARRSIEMLESRTLLSSISDLAYSFLHSDIAANRTAFYVYRDADSGENHGFPSGYFASDPSLIGQIAVNAAAVYDPASPSGVTSSPTALDHSRGNVLEITFPPLMPAQFVGVNIQDPQNYSPNAPGNGYDMVGASKIVFDAASFTSGGMNVQFGVGEKVSRFYHLTKRFSTISISLNTLRDPNTMAVSPPDLTHVNVLFGAAINYANDPGGGTVLLDNVRFEPTPARQLSVPSLPLDTQTFGVVPAGSVGTPIPPDQANRNIASVYASSISIISLLGRPSPANLSDAKRMSDALVYALQNDNQGDLIPPASDGATALHNAYGSGDLPLLNNQQAPAEGVAGQVRLAGFTGPTDSFYLELDGATGGNNAFAMLALMAAYRKFSISSYLNSAEEIGDWIARQLTDTNASDFGGYFNGFNDASFPKTLNEGKSTENNADIFAAFNELATIEASLGNAGLAQLCETRADVAGDFVMAMYDPENERFNAGTVRVGTPAATGIDPTGRTRGQDVINEADFLDSDSFTTLAMASSSRYGNQIDWRLPLEYILNHFAQTVTANRKTFQGFDIVSQPTPTPNADVTTPSPNGVAWEFTGQVVEMMQFVDGLYGTKQFANQAKHYLNQIARAERSAPFANGKGVVAATLENGSQLLPIEQGLTTPFQVIPERVGLPATVWAIMADQHINPLD